MTRRGSLAYYLAAWAIGCFSMTLAIWFREISVGGFAPPLHSYAFDFIALYFYALVFGAALTLLGGFLLRRIMGVLKSRVALYWAFAGAVLAPAMILLVGWTGGRLERMLPSKSLLVEHVYRAVEFSFFFGTDIIMEKGWWLSIPAGAATAYLLCRIERAFAPPEDEQA